MRDYAPTEETIRRECERIKATWSEAERERRRSGLTERQREQARPATIPVVRVAEITTG